MIIGFIIFGVLIACFVSYGIASARDYENGGSKTFWNRNDWDLQQEITKLVWEKMEKKLNIIDADCEDINIYADKLIEKCNLPLEYFHDEERNGGFHFSCDDELVVCAVLKSRRTIYKLEEIYENKYDYNHLLYDKKTYKPLKEFIPEGLNKPCKYFKDGYCEQECTSEGYTYDCLLQKSSLDVEEIIDDMKLPFEYGFKNWLRKNYYDEYKKNNTIWQRYQNAKEYYSSGFYDKFLTINRMIVREEMYNRKYDYLTSYVVSDKCDAEDKKDAINIRKNYPWL